MVIITVLEFIVPTNYLSILPVHKTMTENRMADIIWYIEYLLAGVTYLFVGLLLLSNSQPTLSSILYILGLPLYNIIVLSVIGNLDESTEQQNTD